MKRIAAMEPLSHQHHNALMGCLLIKKGIQKNADKKILKDFAQRLWTEDIQQHIKAEEQFVLPYVARLNNQLNTIVKRDHETIRLLADRISVHDDGYTLFNVFASLLEQHIRFEERIVFNKIQDNLSDVELNKLKTDLAGLHSRKCSDYPVKFWE